MQYTPNRSIRLPNQKLCETFSRDHKAQRVQPVFKSWQWTCSY